MSLVVFIVGLVVAFRRPTRRKSHGNARKELRKAAPRSHLDAGFFLKHTNSCSLFRNTGHGGDDDVGGHHAGRRWAGGATSNADDAGGHDTGFSRWRGPSRRSRRWHAHYRLLRPLRLARSSAGGVGRRPDT